MSTPAAPALAKLEGIVGSAHLVTDPASLTAYQVDDLRPAIAVQPGSVEEVVQVVRFAAAEKLALIAAGGRTKLRIGAPPRRYDVALDLARMDRVEAYDPGDLTLGVEAGIGLAKLLGMLAEHRQIIPLAVPYTSQTTVGGTIATGVDSPLRQFYGTARDFVLGMEFVGGEGVLVKSGGRVVKNVTGYDLHKLMIGALGTLGVITRVNLKTFPLVAVSHGFLASFPQMEPALELRRRIVQSPLQPMTLDILSPEVVDIFATRTPTTLGTPLGPTGSWFSTTEWTLAAAFQGNPQVLERHAKDLTRMAEETHASRIAVLGEDERPLMWGRLRECIPLLLGESHATTILRVSVLPAQMGEIALQLQRTAEIAGLRAAMLLRGVGVIYFALLPETNAMDLIPRLARACADIFGACKRLGGEVVIPWCPTELKRMVDVWGPPRDAFKLMQRLKKAFDPDHIFSPGRFVGGI